MNSKHISAATLLFAPPSFWAGLGQILDFGNTMFEYNQSLTPEQADALAIKADWRAVGDDFRTILEENPATEETKAR